MDDVAVPIFYICNRHLPKEEAGPILRVLSITPCLTGVIHDILDADLALSIVPQIIRSRNAEDSFNIARSVAQQMGSPVLVFGDAEVLDAVFEDGTRVQVGSLA